LYSSVTTTPSRATASAMTNGSAPLRPLPIPSSRPGWTSPRRSSPRCRSTPGSPISLHTPLGEDGDSEFGDLIEDSEAIQPGEAVSFTLLQEQLHSVLDTLSEREAGVVAMRFGLTDGQPKTLDEIGKVYGVTRERIRQIESKTMSKLRHPSRSQVLRDYLD
jgi:RNA polymerase primary sigma factor